MRLLEEYQKSLTPKTVEQLQEENEALYREHPELRPFVKETFQAPQFDEEETKKSMVDQFMGDKLHLTNLDENPTVNFWFGLEEEDYQKILPEGYPTLSHLSRSCKTLKEVDCTHAYSLMWTQHCSQLLEDLMERKNSNFLRSKSPNGAGGLILNGIKGVGKTATLAEMVMWARKNGWIVVYVDGRDLTEKGYIEPNKNDRNLFDQPNQAVKLCKDQLSAHSEILSKLHLKGKVPESIVEAVKVTNETTLADLLQFGASNAAQATEIFEEYRMQLNSVKEYPVLLAVDSYDRFHIPSQFTDRLSLSYQPKLIETNRLVLCRLFSDFDNHGLINGTFMGAFTNGKPKIDWLKKNGHQYCFPLSPWNLTELSSTMEFWKKTDFLSEDSTNKSIYQYYLTLSSGIGSEAFRLAKPL